MPNKNYNSIENYFIDKKQLKRYKKNLLTLGEKVYLTNSHDERSNLNIDADKFEDTHLIFKDSSFENFSIQCDSIAFNVNITFQNCNIKNGNIDCGKNCDVTFNNSKIGNVFCNAKNINLSDVTKFSTSFINKEYKMIAGTENTDLIKIVNSGYTHNPIIIEAQATKILANKSVVLLESKNINNLCVNNSLISLNDVLVNDEVRICNSKIVGIGTNNKENSILTTNNLIYREDVSIDDSIINANKLHVGTNSNLYTNNSLFDINNFVMLYFNSKFISKDYDSTTLNTNRIDMYPLSTIYTSRISKTTDENDFEHFDPNELHNTRENLVKTLSLIKNKYDRPIKYLK